MRNGTVISGNDETTKKTMGNVLDRVTDQLIEVKIFRQIGFKAMLAWHYLIMFSPIFVGPVEAEFAPSFFNRQLTLYISIAVTFAVLFLFSEILSKKDASSSSLVFIAVSGCAATVASMLPMFFPDSLLIPITVLLGVCKATLMYLWIRYYQIVVSHSLIRNLAIDMIGGSLIAFLICILQPPFNNIAVIFLPVAATVSLIICRKTVKGMAPEQLPDRPMQQAPTRGWWKARRFLTMILPTIVFAFVFAFLQGGYASMSTILLMATDPSILLAISVCGLILMAMPKDVGASLGVDTIHRMSVLFFVFGILGLPLLDDTIVIFAEMSVLIGFNLFDFGAMIIGISIVQRLRVEKSFSAVSGRMFAYFSLACGLFVGYVVMTYVDDQMLFGYILSGVAVLLLVVTVVFPLRR
ncbi:MAG TPA: hypothetical protein DEB24_08195, partial [Coriobacteriia bacterium]|nr:hypothetical protein [Coriobacteriia bacterium]